MFYSGSAMPYPANDYLYFILVLPAFILTIWAQYKVTSSFRKYSSVKTAKNITGADAARRVLKHSGIHDVKIERTPGELTDHFDPRNNTIYLSDSVHQNTSISAVGVAAHEAGHAIQYAMGYGPIRLRAAIIPVTNLGSKLAMPLVLLGIILRMVNLIDIGIVLFGTVVIFQLITLPVEFNASSRAIKALGDAGILDTEELPASKKVLSAAALTYVGALALSLAQFLRLVSLSRRRK